MALTLGTINTIFSADTRGLDRGFRRADRAFDEMERKAKRLSGSLDPVNAKTRETGSSMEALGAVTRRTLKNFNRFAGKMRVISFTIGALTGVVVALADELVALGAAAAGVFVNVQLEPVRERMQSISDTAQLAEDRLDTLSDRAAEAGANFITMGSQMGDAVAALNAAGMSFDTATMTAGNLTEAIVTLGGGSDDAGSALEDLAELARSGEVSMDDLRDVVSFTNDPLQTLADTFGVSTERIRDFIDTEQDLGIERIVQVAQQLEGMSQSTTTLTGIFNRTLDAAIDLFETFNQQGGVIEALKNQLDDLAGVLRSDLAEDAILRVARNARVLITETLPNLAQSTVQNWDTILTTVKSVAGFLVGSAVGGVPGGIIGGIIGGMGKTSEVMGTVNNAARDLAPVFEYILAPAISTALGAVNDIIDAFDILGTKLGEAVASDMVGGATVEDRLTNRRKELENAVEARNQLREGMEEGARGGVVDERRLEAATNRIERLRSEVQSLEAAMAFTREPPFEDFLKPGGFNMVSFMEQARREAESFSNVDMSAPFKEFMKPGGFDPSTLVPTGGEGLPSLHQEDPFRDFMRPGGFDVERLVPQASLEVEALSQRLGITIDAAQRAQTAADGIGDAFTSAFQDAIIEGEKLSDVLNQLGKDIASVVLKQGVTQPLGNEIASMAAGGLGQLFGGGATAATTSGTTAASGFVQSGGGAFAKGGVTDQPSIFGEAGPEAAVPLPDGRNIPVNMKGGGTQVNIINQGDSEPEVERRQEGGMEVVDVIIPAVKRAWASGEFDSENRKRYGVKPKPTGRS